MENYVFDSFWKLLGYRMRSFFRNVYFAERRSMDRSFFTNIVLYPLSWSVIYGAYKWKGGTFAVWVTFFGAIPNFFMLLQYRPEEATEYLKFLKYAFSF